MMQIVPLKIQKETSSEKEDYLKTRCSKFEKALKVGAPDRDASQDESKKQECLRHLLLLAEGRLADFSLTSPEDSDALANAQSLKEKVDAVFPLVDGEALIEEQTGQAGNTIYVKQVTNLSTIYFTDDSPVSVPEGVGAAESPVPAAGAASDNAKEEAEALQKVAKTVVDIGKGLSKIVPAPYGTVLSGVFEGFSAYLSMTTSSQSSQDTEKMIQRIGELVGKITWGNSVKQTIKEQAGVVYGVIDGLNDHYGPLKKESKTDDTRKELVDNYLTPYLLKLDTVINTLSQSDFDVASLPEYCLAAGAYFCVLQELAVLDADHQNDPFQSPRCKELKDVKAPRFIKYVNDTYDKIIKKAKDSVSSTTELKYDLRLFRSCLSCPNHETARVEKKWKEVEGIGTLPVGTDYYGAWYYDNGTFGSSPDGFIFCTCHSTWAWETCSKARDIWISKKQQELVDQIESEMGSLKKLANEEWSKLKTRPLYGSDRMS